MISAHRPDFFHCCSIFPSSLFCIRMHTLHSIPILLNEFDSWLLNDHHHYLESIYSVTLVEKRLPTVRISQLVDTHLTHTRVAWLQRCSRGWDSALQTLRAAAVRYRLHLLLQYLVKESRVGKDSIVYQTARVHPYLDVCLHQRASGWGHLSQGLRLVGQILQEVLLHLDLSSTCPSLHRVSRSHRRCCCVQVVPPRSPLRRLHHCTHRKHSCFCSLLVYYDKTKLHVDVCYFSGISSIDIVRPGSGSRRCDELLRFQLYYKFLFGNGLFNSAWECPENEAVLVSPLTRSLGFSCLHVTSVQSYIFCYITLTNK